MTNRHIDYEPVPPTGEWADGKMDAMVFRLYGILEEEAQRHVTSDDIYGAVSQRMRFMDFGIHVLSVLCTVKQFYSQSPKLHEEWHGTIYDNAMALTKVLEIAGQEGVGGLDDLKREMIHGWDDVWGT